jgi:hypothetical protein
LIDSPPPSEFRYEIDAVVLLASATKEPWRLTDGHQQLIAEALEFISRQPMVRQRSQSCRGGVESKIWTQRINTVPSLPRGQEDNVGIPDTLFHLLPAFATVLRFSLGTNLGPSALKNWTLALPSGLGTFVYSGSLSVRTFHGAVSTFAEHDP